MPATSKTDWARVKLAAASNAAIPFEPGDGPYDPNDEAATEAAWESGRVTHGVRGKQKKPTKLLVPIRLSRAVVDHFKAQGSGWQTRIDQALVRVVEQDLRQSSAKK